MKAYGKSWGYNVYDCEYCLYWKGTKIGCTYEDGCCCPVPQKPKKCNGITMNYEQPAEQPIEQPPISECVGCPYGRDSPCIGWCTKDVMRSVGLMKERDKDNV